MGIDDERRLFYDRLNAGELNIISSTSRAAVGRNNFNLNFGGGGNGFGTAAARAVYAQQAKPQPPIQQKPDILALTEAANNWARSTTDASLERAKDIRRDKLRAVGEFFAFIEKDLPDVRPPDVRLWIESLEARGLDPKTIYTRCGHLSRFFKWLMEQPELQRFFRLNPVRAAMPKCPKPYQSGKTQALDAEWLNRLWRVLEEAARESIIGCRDRAIFLFFISTGDRREEIIRLRGQDIIIDPDGAGLTYQTRRKGGERSSKRIDDRDVVEALVKYIRRSGRKPEKVFRSDAPLWLAHDRARAARKEKKKKDAATKNLPAGSLLLKGRAKIVERGLTSRAFDQRIKIYAELAGIPPVRLHQFRHTVAAIVAEETGSLHEAQEMLGHQSMQTTRIYVPNITVRANPHSSRLKNRILGGSNI